VDVEGVFAESSDFVAFLYFGEAYGALMHCCCVLRVFHGLSYGVGYVE
jgi:hypothetical protein